MNPSITRHRLFVSAAIALCALVAAPAWAQLGEVNLQFEDSEGPADATIIVPVQIVSLVGASTVFFKVDADGASLELVDVFPGQSTVNAGKEVSVGTDMQNRPTILVTDFGGGGDIIQNGDLVFLIFRSAPGLSVGTELPVTATEASAAAPAGDMLSTVAFGATVEIVACFTPARPSFIAASDGTLADRVAIGWLPIAGASEYLVYRNSVNNFGSAELIATVETTIHDDITATAAVVAMGGCQGQTLPQFEAFYYWVVAANACGMSPPSPADTGFRGLDPVKDAPLEAAATPLIGLALAAGYAFGRRRTGR